MSSCFFSATATPEIDNKYPSQGSWAHHQWTKNMHTSVDLTGMDSGIRLRACKYLVSEMSLQYSNLALN